ncbi:MAG: hypothetical protein K8S56_05710 [Candidatus Cloacimonetes bacterium]|nr:hypothetical protein [Candidatus Cloacimonadota bacterium]
MDHPKKLKDTILKKEKEEIAVFMTHEGLCEADIEELVRQPVEGLLYDLNRDRSTILAFIEDPKWINDFAVMLIIKKLKEYYDSREK